MINLIPPQGHTALKHEYLLRVGTVYAFLLAGVFVSGTILLVPTYVLTSSQLTGAKDRSAEIEETKKAFDVAFEEIKVANTLMAKLRTTEDEVFMTEIVEDIIRLAPEGVRFSGFQTVRESVSLTAVTVEGIASTRQALATFKTQVESDARFKEVQVPIADLARDTNLPFSVTVTLEAKSDTPTP